MNILWYIYENQFIFFNLLDLKVKNERLKDYIKDLEAQLDDHNKKLKDSQELTETLTIINEQFRKENDNIYRRLGIYKIFKSQESWKKDQILNVNMWGIT